MKICPECKEKIKYGNTEEKLKEHYQRFHALPYFTKNGQVCLNAPHQVVLIVKSSKTWLQYFRENKKKDSSWFKDGEKLKRFEKENNIEFHYCRDSQCLSFQEIETPLTQKIRNFFEPKHYLLEGNK